MTVLKKLACTTLATISLGMMANTASAELTMGNQSATLSSNTASFMPNEPQSKLQFSTPTTIYPQSFATPTLSGNSPTLYYPTTATNQPTFFNDKVQGLIAKAKTLIGLPYRFGGTSPVSGFDCSGFMQYIFKQTAGINLPRRSEDMASSGRSVSRGDLQAGDMVFFKTHGSSISHVGMYIGNNQFIHSPRTGKSIEITSLGSGYWAKTFVTARRVLSENA